jgi:predicted nucleotidyltransferase
VIPARRSYDVSQVRETSLKRQLEKADQDGAILAVCLFGSAARIERTASSDVDVAIVLRDPKPDRLVASRRRLEYMELQGLDVHVVQPLPIYIWQRVLKEGRVLFVRDDER